MKQIIFFVLAAISLFITPALSLFAGIVFALIFGCIFEKRVHKFSSLLLKVAIVGLGFGMNIIDSLKSSSDGIIFTIVSVCVVMILGVLISRWMSIDKGLGYLISSGTAICGGSAIAAIAPVIRTKTIDTSIAFAVIFTLNAVAMLAFPFVGHFLELSQDQFGMWSAIAIHDTSAVVGAAKSYGDRALEIATTVKLSRALWIIPLSIISAFIFRKENKGTTNKISIPWFILFFIIAMCINTYYPLNNITIPSLNLSLGEMIKVASHESLSFTLFLIGTMISVNAIKQAGLRPILLGVILWIVISVMSLIVIIFVI